MERVCLHYALCNLPNYWYWTKASVHNINRKRRDFMNFIDFFAGIGGFHSGLEQAGHHCVGWVEWDQHARKSYQAMYNVGGLYNAKDIAKIKSGKELPEADIWTFGSPCQNISLAGNRQGLKGNQSSLFFEVMRLLKDRPEVSKPKYLFMENVKNLLSINGGRDFAKVLIEMDKAGYDVEWQVINSSWVIPQNRERIFIIGHRRGVDTNQIFPITSKEIGKHRKYNVLKDVLEEKVDAKFYLSEAKMTKLLANGLKEDLEKANKINVIGNYSTTGFVKDDIVSDKGISKTLMAVIDGHQPVVAKTIKVLGNTSSTGHHSEDVLKTSGISKTLTASSYKHIPIVATKINRIYNASEHGLYGGSSDILHTNGLSSTITAQNGGWVQPKVVTESKPANKIKRAFNGRKHGLFGTANDVLFDDGLVTTLNTMQGGDREPKVIVDADSVFNHQQESKNTDNSTLVPHIPIKNGTKKGYLSAELYDGVDTSYPFSKMRRGRVQKQRSQTLTTDDSKAVIVNPILTPDRLVKRQNGRRFKLNNEPAFTLTSTDKHGIIISNGKMLAIRKLTPLECWRLQGFSDEQFYKAKSAGVSNSQLYKQAGNAVTVPVIYAIAKRF